MEYVGTAILVMEIMGTIAFAASGAMVAIHRGMDLFGICVLGVMTAVGGGMTRDVILCTVPKALTNPLYTALAALVSIALFMLIYIRREHWLERQHIWYDRAMFVMDSIGLGAFTAVGVTTGIECGYTDKTFLLVFLGTLTGVGGGLLRDIMAQQEPYILVRHVYACASIVGALSCVILYRCVGEMTALIVSALVVVVIRVLAAHYHWNLPRLEL
ncbi:MAG: TRIC cation channel family protein [Lachnospiraceae bacterium]|nr:TRIC cation channel family protein [Lachnospiraceae bacterium]